MSLIVILIIFSLVVLIVLFYRKGINTVVQKKPSKLYCEKCKKEYVTFFKDCPVCTRKYTYGGITGQSDK